MTRVEIMATLRRCGVDVVGLYNNNLKVNGREMPESQALKVIAALSQTHCLHCGRPHDNGPKAA